MRAAALDLGSNSFNVLIAEIRGGRELSVVERAKRMPRIGEAIFRTGEITDKARKRALQALADLWPVIKQNRPDAVLAVATSAIREANNGGAFVAEVRDTFGVDVRVISGDEEARLSYAGARARLDELGRATMFDLGGGSLEVVVGEHERIIHVASAPLGVLRAVAERPLSDPATVRELRALEYWARRQVSQMLEPLRIFDLGQVVLCAGTARALRSVARGLGHLPATGPEGNIISRDILRAVINQLAPMPVEARREIEGLDPGRADLIVHGAVVLDAILAIARVAEARVCRAGLREGVILAHAAAIEGVGSAVGTPRPQRRAQSLI